MQENPTELDISELFSAVFMPLQPEELRSGGIRIPEQTMALMRARMARIMTNPTADLKPCIYTTLLNLCRVLRQLEYSRASFICYSVLEKLPELTKEEGPTSFNWVPSFAAASSSHIVVPLLDGNGGADAIFVPSP